MAPRRIRRRLDAERAGGMFPHRRAIMTAGHGLILRHPSS
jgi:hypothetical protein